jgi:hypothetical protein
MKVSRHFECLEFGAICCVLCALFAFTLYRRGDTDHW